MQTLLETVAGLSLLTPSPEINALVADLEQQREKIDTVLKALAGLYDIRPFGKVLTPLAESIPNGIKTNGKHFIPTLTEAPPQDLAHRDRSEEPTVRAKVLQVVEEHVPRTAIETNNRIQELWPRTDRNAVSTTISVLVREGKLRKGDDLTLKMAQAPPLP